MVSNSQFGGIGSNYSGFGAPPQRSASNAPGILGSNRPSTPSNPLQSLFASSAQNSSTQSNSNAQVSPGSRYSMQGGMASTNSSSGLNALFQQQNPSGQNSFLSSQSTFGTNSFGSGANQSSNSAFSTSTSRQSAFGAPPTSAMGSMGFPSSFTLSSGTSTGGVGVSSGRNSLDTDLYRSGGFNNFFDTTTSSQKQGFSESEFPSLNQQSNKSRSFPQSGFYQPTYGGFGGYGQGQNSISGLGVGHSGPKSLNHLLRSSGLTGEVQSEFTINNEEFPALPAMQQQQLQTASNAAVAAAVGAASVQQALVAGGQPIVGAPAQLKNGLGPEGMGETSPTNLAFQAMPLTQTIDTAAQPTSQSTMATGIQTMSSGKVSNIPPKMIKDQYGMVGLLTFLRAIETDPAVVALALGQDLTSLVLGLNLNASDRNLFQTFGGPWSDVPARPQDIDVVVPDEYITYKYIREKLAPIKLNRYTEELLFFLFYLCTGEFYQIAAAAELYGRDWRYHKVEKCWITKAQGMAPVQLSNTSERGTYYVWEPSVWRRVTKEMRIDYDKLEERPQLPQPQGHANQTAVSQ